MTRFKLIFACGIRGGFNVIVLHIDTHFSKYHLMKRLSIELLLQLYLGILCESVTGSVFYSIDLFVYSSANTVLNMVAI